MSFIPITPTESNPGGLGLHAYAVMQVFAHYDDPIEIQHLRVFSNETDADNYEEILKSMGGAFTTVVRQTTTYVW
jgi:hypothetical protein